MSRSVSILVFLSALSAAPAAAAARGGAIAGEVVVMRKGLGGGASPKADRSGVVVWLEGVPQRPVATRRAAIRQRDKQFEPRLVVIAKGSQVEFPNDDRIFHNVFSLSSPAKFDLGLYKSGATRTITFDRVGTVDVYCNIHPDMAATIKVLADDRFVVTDASGRFQFADVPPGTYAIVAWVPRGEESRGQVTVAAGATTSTKLQVAEGGGGAAHHLRKDGTPYGRYQ
jgi:plastocyanin